MSFRTTGLPFSRRQIAGLVAIFVGLAWMSHWVALHKGMPHRLVRVIAGRPDASMRVAFSPGSEQNSAEHLALSEINRAHDQILIAANELTSVPVIEALVDAHEMRKVNVMAVLDRSQGNPSFSAARILHDSGIDVRIEKATTALRDQFVIVDGATVQTGSFRYEQMSGRDSADNAIAIDDDDVARQYVGEWLRLWNESEPFSVTRKS